MKAKQLIGMLAVAALIPGMAFAQTHALTRAEVKAQVVQAERNGTLHISNTQYPEGVTRPDASAPSDSGYGPATQANSQTGVRVGMQPATMSGASDTATLYEHH